MSYRREKILSLIRHLVAREIVKLFPGAIITVTRVKTSADFRHATVFVSIFPEKDEQHILRVLAQHCKKFNRRLFMRLTMKTPPVIVFQIDRQEQKQRRVEKLLQEAAIKYHD